MLVSVWHLLHHACPYADLGSTHFDARNHQSVERRLIRRVGALGHTVHLDSSPVPTQSAA